MTSRRSERVRCSHSRSFLSRSEIEFLSDLADVSRLVINDWKHSAQEEQPPSFDHLDVGAEWSWRIRQRYAQALQPALSAGIPSVGPTYHRPTCAPPSTCSTSPVTWRASAR